MRWLAFWFIGACLGLFIWAVGFRMGYYSGFAAAMSMRTWRGEERDGKR